MLPAVCYPEDVRSKPPASSSVGLAVRVGSGARPTAYARAVLDVVDRIPAGRVLTYGDVAELLGRGSPRTVGTVLSDHGREVPWQRVVQASGRPAEPHLQEALRLLAAEGCPRRGEKVDLAAARWDGGDLAGELAAGGPGAGG